MLFPKKQKQFEPPRRRERPQPPQERATETELQQRYSFRRNRTLTGSASSRVISTNETNAQLQSPRVQVHELAKKRRHIGVILLLVLAGAGILYGLVWQFTTDVEIKVSNTTIPSETAYKEAIQSYLSSQPIERLRFLTNKKRLNDYIHTKTPEVASVQVDGSAGFDKSQFILTMREPIAGWSINNQQQYVDASGTSFTQNYFAAPAVQIVDNSGARVETGQAVASNRFLAFVGRSVGLAKLQGYTVTQVIIPRGTTRQIELRINGINYPVKLSVDRGVGEQVEDMARALHWLSDHKQSPQYLDVRVSGKAFYR